MTNMVERNGNLVPSIDFDRSVPSQLAEKIVAYRRALESGDKAEIEIDRLFLELELRGYGLEISDIEERFFDIQRAA